MIIYLITNLINGKKYIGQTVRSLEERWKRHCWKSTAKNSMPICKAITKYGKEHFTIEIVAQCISQNELDEKELFYANALNTWSPNGYNLKAGKGKGSMSFATKIKIAKANTGKKRSVIARQNMSKAHLGKTLSVERKNKISAANKGKNNPFYGRTHSQETLDKISKTYTIVSPNGEIMTIKNMAEHCRQYNLNKGNMNSLVRGNRSSCQGWTLYKKESASP